MKEVTNETEPKIAYYATHHGIYRPEKSTTKLRVVFNCSSLTDNGISLNDIQYNGGVIQEDLYAQMLRFRTYTYAFTADIKMMYRTILINPKQRSLQRIVWCESEHESPKIYELWTVTYGTVSAPYLAQRTLTQLSMDEEANFPIAASVLRNNLYMDDVLCGAATLEEAIVLRQQLKGILKSAGMELHKLCANHEKLSPDPEQNYNFATLTETKTLGVSWKPNLDCLLIKVKVCLDSSYTKRDVLSTIANIFDPVGLMTPVISKAKIFLQRLWRSKLEWNDLLPAEEYREWQQFLVSLENINNIEIPRRIFVAFPEVTKIHGFADASERCYGAAVYCKSKNLKSETLVRLITSKSRVAPIKSLTIPRLELCAAVLLAKLVKRVVAALQLETAEVYLWSDSMIVLAWLRKESMDLKTFVQNRVAKIQELYPNQLWRHVPSDQNPADLVSRGVDPEKLLQQNLWFNGPTFLSVTMIAWLNQCNVGRYVSSVNEQRPLAACKEKRQYRWIPRGVSFQRPRHRLIAVASLGRLSRNRSIPVWFTRYPRTALSDRWRSLGITSLMNIGGIRYLHIHSYIGHHDQACVLACKIQCISKFHEIKLKS
ncbi:uncharacterized protein TNCV_5116701 [Trichonephila clavipes]|nr:uncharacterized protein TNCV_5116701 [Trichonephila clavipes]